MCWTACAGSLEGMTQITDEQRFTRAAPAPAAVPEDAVEHAIRHTTLRALGFVGMVALYLLHTGSSLAWGAAGLLAALTLAGFVLSRTTGLPSSHDDVGNWTEGLGLASMFVEGAVIVLSAYALALARRERRPGIHASGARRVTASS